MVRRNTFLAATAIFCALGASAAMGQAPAAPKTIALKGADGRADAGSATAIEGPSGVLLRVEVKGLTPGWHGMHLHEKGDCSDPKFTSAGAHMNHAAADAKKPHGLLNGSGGPDFGDLPNIHVGADGVGRAEVFTQLIRMGALLEGDGTALVIHAGPDDHRSQPIGGAGDRVACGVIR